MIIEALNEDDEDDGEDEIDDYEITGGTNRTYPY